MTFRVTVALFYICFFVGECFGTSSWPDHLTSKNLQATSLCSLQQEVAEGDHRIVQISGVFSEGLERGTLEDAACPNEITWVELRLKTNHNREKLRKILNHSHQARIVVEGEFYGPPLPDPKLPEAIRKSYHPGWGHLAAFKTKMIVHTIIEVHTMPHE